MPIIGNRIEPTNAAEEKNLCRPSIISPVRIAVRGGANFRIIFLSLFGSISFIYTRLYAYGMYTHTHTIVILSARTPVKLPPTGSATCRTCFFHVLCYQKRFRFNRNPIEILNKNRTNIYLFF